MTSDPTPTHPPAPLLGATADGERDEVEIVTTNAAETHALGLRLGRLLRRGDVLLLHGDLGAGKTTLAQGIAAGLGINAPVQSPTFTLVNEYDGRDAAGSPLRLYHIDLYRLTSDDLDSFGFDDYLAPADGVALIEWPERATDRLDGHALLVSLTPAGTDRRRIILAPFGAGDHDRHPLPQILAALNPPPSDLPGIP